MSNFKLTLIEGHIREGRTRSNQGSLDDFFVLGPPGRVDDAQKRQLSPTNITYPLDTTGWNFDGIAGFNLTGLIIDVHFPVACQDIVDLIGFEPMFKGSFPRRHYRMGKGIAPIEGVVTPGVKNLTEQRSISGGNLRAVFEFLYQHGYLVVLTKEKPRRAGLVRVTGSDFLLAY